MFRSLKHDLYECGFTQKTFADAVGVQQGTVSRWIKRKSKPNAETIPVMAAALKKPNSYLVEYFYPGVTIQPTPST